MTTESTTTTDTITVSDDLLDAIRTEAGEHGEQVTDCTRAIAGDTAAMTRVAQAATYSEYSTYRIAVDAYGQAYLTR